MWTIDLNEDLKKVILDSDTKGPYYLNYSKSIDGICLSKEHLVESGMNLFDLADIASALELCNRKKQPRIYICNCI